MYQFQNYVVVLELCFINHMNQESFCILDQFHAHVLVVEVDNKIQSESSIIKNEKLCTLCEDFTSKALYYLGENETQTQVLSTLHKACSTLHSFKQQVCLPFFLCGEHLVLIKIFNIHIVNSNSLFSSGTIFFLSVYYIGRLLCTNVFLGGFHSKSRAVL